MQLTTSFAFKKNDLLEIVVEDARFDDPDKDSSTFSTLLVNIFRNINIQFIITHVKYLLYKDLT